ncbi:hypothetical protein [Croceicoccus sediminis]|uniref:hypothetical protein n=1 Tax=Croceicoccus sediminis TaxID=2571150 RepID=UPI001182911E|nr:hypothetical protein [Croceicoccus sediminis]
MAYERLSAHDVRAGERWRGMAFGRIQSGPFAGRVISVVEFSETGCRIRDHEMTCEPGDVFHLMLEDVGPMVADVRWKNGAFFGVSFRVPLRTVVLNHLRDETSKPLQDRMARLMDRGPKL